MHCHIKTQYCVVPLYLAECTVVGKEILCPETESFVELWFYELWRDYRRWNIFLLRCRRWTSGKDHRL